jgi:hypothetical protein
MIEVIHCHIMKTGGVSFLEVIENMYGKDAIAFPWIWMGMAPESNTGRRMLYEQWPELYKKWHEIVPKAVASMPQLKVLQGHHPVGLFNHLFPKAKRIAWVRHPIARVVSQYHHDMKKRHQPAMSLERYIRLPYNQNVMSFMLGHNIDNMDWIGVLERIDDDIVELAELLEWPSIPNVPHLNKSNRQMDFHGLGQEIADLNMRDMNIYAEVIGRKGLADYYG